MFKFLNSNVFKAKAAVKHICSTDRCSAEHFQAVLIKLEEWRQIQENAYWDFMSLDKDGSRTLPLSTALFLARCGHIYCGFGAKL